MGGHAPGPRHRCNWFRPPTRSLVFALFTSGCSEHAVLDLFPETCQADCVLGGSGKAATTTSGPAGTTGGGASSASDSGSRATDSGSSASDGGSSGGLGSGGSSAGCGPLVTRVRISELALPAPAVLSNEMPIDEYYPVLLAPMSNHTSLLGYKEADSARATVLELDQDDLVVRTVFQTEAEEAHALLAHDDGGALVYVRDDPDIFSPEFCRREGNGLFPCGSLELERFDLSGKVLMSATLTDKLNVETEGALFIWWFEHTARLAWAEDSYGVYFRSARTIPTPSGLTPRPGDTLRFVDSAGNRLSRGWDFGCVPSWSVRIAYSQVWAAVCHGETPNAHRMIIFDGDEQRELQLLAGIPPAYRALGGLSVHGDDFLLSYVERTANATDLHLARIDREAQVVFDEIVPGTHDLDFQEGYVFRAYHANYGDELLLGWKVNNQLFIARADRDTGEVLEGPVAAGAPIDRFIEFLTFPNGDVGWADANAEGSVSVMRVLACHE